MLPKIFEIYKSYDIIRACSRNLMYARENYVNWCLLSILLFKMFYVKFTIICNCYIHLKNLWQIDFKRMIVVYRFDFTESSFIMFNLCFWLRKNKVWIQFTFSQFSKHFKSQHSFHKSAPHQHSRNSFVQQRMIYMSRKIKVRFFVSIICSV